jgi:hypothetical protein
MTKFDINRPLGRPVLTGPEILPVIAPFLRIGAAMVEGVRNSLNRGDLRGNGHLKPQFVDAMDAAAHKAAMLALTDGAYLQAAEFGRVISKVYDKAELQRFIADAFEQALSDRAQPSKEIAAALSYGGDFDVTGATFAESIAEIERLVDLPFMTGPEASTLSRLIGVVDATLYANVDSRDNQAEVDRIDALLDRAREAAK